MNFTAGMNVRLLFCFYNTQVVNGANRFALGLIQHLSEASDITVEIFSRTEWAAPYDGPAKCLPHPNIEDIAFSKYDAVILCNIYLIPHVLAFTGNIPVVYLCQNYDSFCHGTTYAQLMEDKAVFKALLQLPIHLLTISKSIQTLLETRVGKTAYCLPIAFDKHNFTPRPCPPESAVKRVLMVGNHLAPVKGMSIGFEALKRLAPDLAIQLVLVTPEPEGLGLLKSFPYPVELHVNPPQETLPSIYASCHVYCCSSFYEGLGLPALEAFFMGVPVVSTRNYGISDYGIDGQNCVLAEPNNSMDLYKQLKHVLIDASFTEGLREQAFQTVQGQFEWAETVTAFHNALTQIRSHQAEQPAVTDVQHLQLLIQQLEEAGYDLSPEHYQGLEALSESIESCCRNLQQSDSADPSCLQAISALQTRISPFLQATQSPYYPYFKSRYDLFNLILSLQDEPEFDRYLRLLLDRQSQPVL
jgi:glycosyltransferase involved in cell wall biosynthesis